MVRSMTGFGRYELNTDEMKITVEIKTVNHRYSDVNIRMTRQISFLEDKVRGIISDKVSRGKVDIFISYENNSEGTREVVLDKDLVKAYHNALKDISESFNLRDDISVSSLARFPDVIRVEKSDDEESIWSVLKQAVTEAIEKLINMREVEGAKLKESILDTADNINAFADDIKKRSPLVVQEYKEKLKSRLEELLDKKPVDEVRLAMEIAVFADRCSIDEELVRLSSHIFQLRQILDMKMPVGRKLDFLIQEMNREVNTIGSKANDLEITKNVVELKSEIEKIREQIQNIE